MKGFISFVLVVIVACGALGFTAHHLQKAPAPARTEACWVVNNQLTPEEKQFLWSQPHAELQVESECAVALVMLLRGYRLEEVR